ncbi:nucleotide pyrophosphatase [Nocardia panacis]|uniref:Nucleotide pyrophosphatase n=1 Tax=Nocardia panacis TaxID=2340916 RepID=A0A3A4JRT4_9NOCA|nr:alkaline phosphatase family protein [Nocardia panacis]RJO68391.1 nucleotide pyrophosphatase [Nocardia panacis]
MNRRQLLAKAVALMAVTVPLITGRAKAGAAPLPADARAGAAAATTPKVVLIGLDGLMYHKVQQVRARNLLRLAAEGLLTRGSIAPHTTISGPSWATVLTGVWDGKHGIRDNEFDAAPFARYPSVFTRLKRHDPTLKLHSITTWDRLALISASGEQRADVVMVTPESPHDPKEIATDCATADSVVTAVTRFAPDFLFTHLDQVDRAGHRSGGASEDYLEAVHRIDGLVGRIVAAVDARAAAHPSERWTVLVTADHGHTPRGGHGGQTEDETTNFVIARGPDFAPGATGVRTLVDLTPTILDLHGAPPAGYADGVSLREGPAAHPLSGGLAAAPR